MKRSVIQIAESTQLISLPRAWCKQFDIKKGDELDVEPKGSTLEVTTTKGVDIERVSINLDKYNPLIPRVLHALYKKGYDEIEAQFSHPDQLRKIQRLLQEDLVGYEIIKQTKNSCTIKSIAGAYEEEFETMLRRTFLVFKSMAMGIYEALKDGNTLNIQTLRYLETNNNRSTGFCRRIINKRGYKDHKNTTFMYSTLEEIEKMADEFKYLCDFLLQKEKNIQKIPEEILDCYKELVELVDMLYDVFYKFDEERLSHLFVKRSDLINKAYDLYSLKNERDLRLLHYIVTITQQIANTGSFRLEMQL